MGISVLFQIVILIFSVMIHEVSHGTMALLFGDKTALYEGRLTLNPLKHIDWVGSFLLPLFLWLTNAGFMIGWAKPVPYNVYNLKHRTIAEPLVALAGPLSNILIAVIFGLLIRFLASPNAHISAVQASNMISVFGFVVILNIGLALFNLIPFPPLDGSKVLFSIIPFGKSFIFSHRVQSYGIFVMILLFALFSTQIANVLMPLMSTAFTVITGLPLN